MSILSSATVIVSQSRRSPSMNSTLSHIHAGFPRRCVCGSRLSRTRTFQPSRTRRSATCEPIRPAPPVTRARFIFLSRHSTQRAPLLIPLLEGQLHSARFAIDLLDQSFLVKTWRFPALRHQTDFRRAIRCTRVAMLWDRQRRSTAATILPPDRFLLRAPSSARALAPYSNRYARTFRDAAFSG